MPPPSRRDFNPRSPCGERRGATSTRTRHPNFNPRSPCGERRLSFMQDRYGTQFQSTLPVWGATVVALTLDGYAAISTHAPRVGSDHRLGGRVRVQAISIHAPRVGSDALYAVVIDLDGLFQSTLPVWGATRTAFSPLTTACLFQSTLPVWGATRRPGREARMILISIHAPRVGSDTTSGSLPRTAANFNPRSPCGERRFPDVPNVGDVTFQSTLPVWGATPKSGNYQGFWTFQSTLPVWGATPPWSARASGRGDFNPRSPCGERPPFLACGFILARISIHAPRVGSDGHNGYFAYNRVISIHAPRVGSDRRGRGTRCRCSDFNPRSPCGERRRRHHPGRVRGKISIHAPRVGSDLVASRDRPPHPIISIHAPRVGSDRADRGAIAPRHYFNPRSPCGERQQSQIPQARPPLHFNPRSPCGERPFELVAKNSLRSFQSTLPVWGATLSCKLKAGRKIFQSTLPVWGATRVCLPAP